MLFRGLQVVVEFYNQLEAGNYSNSSMKYNRNNNNNTNINNNDLLDFDDTLDSLNSPLLNNTNTNSPLGFTSSSTTITQQQQQSLLSSTNESAMTTMPKTATTSLGVKTGIPVDTSMIGLAESGLEYDTAGKSKARQNK